MEGSYGAPSAPEELGESAEHLRLLSIFHYVVAGIQALFALFPILHLAVGLVLLTGHPESLFGEGAAPPGQVDVPFLRFFGAFFVCFASAWIVSGLALAICMVLAGRYLAERRKRTFCMIVAAVSCMFVPFGTVLGVFTLIVLSRPAVKAAFA